MKCDGCGVNSKKRPLNMIAEPGKRVVNLCPKCWHKYMHHPKWAIPEGQEYE